LRAVLDTTVWCSAFLTLHEESAARLIWNAWRNGLFVAVVSGPIVDEVGRILIEELDIPEYEVEEFVLLLCAVADVVPIQHQVMGCRDPNDDMFVETALVGKANFIVTHDDDLLYLPVHVRESLAAHGVQVLPDARTGVRDFCSVLRDLTLSPEE
jgi:putative PIN family toxin of toxin-antitoxin system